MTVVDGWYCDHGVLFAGLSSGAMVWEMSQKGGEPNGSSFVPQGHGGLVSASSLVNW